MAAKARVASVAVAVSRLEVGALTPRHGWKKTAWLFSAAVKIAPRIVRQYPIDEALTPDSSRYWESATYQIGTSPDSYDKQFVRDWLTRSGWDKESDPPELPPDVVTQTRIRYMTAYERLVGKPLFPRKARNE